jgi:hypothetical protein
MFESENRQISKLAGYKCNFFQVGCIRTHISVTNNCGQQNFADLDNIAEFADSANYSEFADFADANVNDFAAQAKQIVVQFTESWCSHCLSWQS